MTTDNTPDTDTDDTEGHGKRPPGIEDAGAADDTEGHGIKFKGITDAGEDDTEGHLRMTDEQLAAGVTPSDVQGNKPPTKALKLRP